MNQVTAKLNYLHIAPRKVRLVTDSLKGLPAQEAEAQLLFRNKRSAKPLLKLLRSAMANIKNQNFSVDNFYISTLKVDQGPMLKRGLPRAMGRVTPIQKKSSHITMILSESDKRHVLRYNITTPKKEKRTAKKKSVKKSAPAFSEKTRKETVEKKPGFFQRIFRRKSI